MVPGKLKNISDSWEKYTLNNSLEKETKTLHRSLSYGFEYLEDIKIFKNIKVPNILEQWKKRDISWKQMVAGCDHKTPILNFDKEAIHIRMN